MIRLRGKERSGTTWLEMLLRYNYRVGEVDAHRKHFFDGDIGLAYSTKVLVISKHPLAWFYSYSKYLGLPLYAVPIDIFDSWFIFHKAWLQFATEQDVSFIRYEDLFHDPEQVLNAIGLERNDFSFDPISDVVTSDGDIIDVKFKRDMRDVVLAYEQYPETRKAVKRLFDDDVMHDLGYLSNDLEEI